jgi:hypothetical protein
LSCSCSQFFLLKSSGRLRQTELRGWSWKLRLTAVGNCCADHATPLYPQKLAITSATNGGHSVGMVHLWTKSHGVS